MRTDDGVGAHHAVLFRSQMHGAALAAHQPVVALHQFAEHLLDWHAARESVGVTAVRAEREIPFLHGAAEPRCNRLLSEGQMARALYEVLEKEIERTLLRIANSQLRTIQFEPLCLSDIVVRF